jgi:dTDP-4-dehydrorhamnose reductase
MKKKVLVLGSGGMAGHILTLRLRRYPDRFQVTDIARRDHAVKPGILLDITDLQALRMVLEEQQADIIVNCIGVLNQDAEERPDKAVFVNSYLPHFLEQFTRNSSARVIHISTDCVFSGSRGGYLESDLRDGSGFYAQSKALGELINTKDLTLRTSIIGPELNANGIGLFNWFSKQQDAIKGYTEVFWTGITTLELADTVLRCIDLNIHGLYHLVNGEKISKYALLELFLRHLKGSKVSGITPYDRYKVDKSLINSRTDYDFDIPSYDRMTQGMIEWIYANRALYPHYRDL